MTGSPSFNGSLTHEPDRFSDAAWDLLLSAQDVARRWRHEQLDVEHLIQVLFTDPAVALGWKACPWWWMSCWTAGGCAG
jgi:hypothetical protein